MAKTLLVLTSAVTLNREQFQNQRRAMTVLQANHIPYETIDGADPLYRDRYVHTCTVSLSYKLLQYIVLHRVVYRPPCNAALRCIACSSANRVSRRVSHRVYYQLKLTRYVRYHHDRLLSLHQSPSDAMNSLV
jgi:hypothetical protein